MDVDGIAMAMVVCLRRVLKMCLVEGLFAVVVIGV